MDLAKLKAAAGRVKGGKKRIRHAEYGRKTGTSKRRLKRRKHQARGYKGWLTRVKRYGPKGLKRRRVAKKRKPAKRKPAKRKAKARKRKAKRKVAKRKVKGKTCKKRGCKVKVRKTKKRGRPPVYCVRHRTAA